MYVNDDESLFAAETTPLILAAQRNRYEIVSYLVIQKGICIVVQHVTVVISHWYSYLEQSQKW